MKRLLEILLGLIASVGTPFLLISGYGWVYSGWWTTAPDGDPFAVADFLGAFRSYALPVAVISAMMVGLVMAWRPAKRSWFMVVAVVAVIPPILLTLMQSRNWGEDWLWRGAPAVAVSLSWVPVIVWTRYRWASRVPGVVLSLAVWLVSVGTLHWVIPTLWLRDPVLREVQVERIDQGFAKHR